MAHAGEVLFKIVADGLSDYSKTNALLLQERWCGFPTLRSIMAMIFATRKNLDGKHACCYSGASSTFRRHTTPKTAPSFNSHLLSSDC